jgi:hypothetical protein
MAARQGPRWVRQGSRACSSLEAHRDALYQLPAVLLIPINAIKAADPTSEEPTASEPSCPSIIAAVVCSCDLRVGLPDR